MVVKEKEKEKYIKKMFNKLTEWMLSNGYNIGEEVGIYEVFTKGNNINTHYDSLGELYANFKFLVNGFVNYQK